MEMEHINENTIRVKIENTDLEERGITFLDLLGNQKQIENFFYSILEEVDIHEEFQQTDAVTFQVVPNKNGLELYISKGNNFKDMADEYFSEDEIWKEDAKLMMNDLDENSLDEKADDIDEYQEEEGNTMKKIVVVFKEFDDFIQLSKHLYMECGLSNLYYYNERYYAELIFFVDEMIIRTPEAEIAVAVEYGEKAKLTGDVLNEYGKKIMETNALELTRHYFPN